MQVLFKIIAMVLFPFIFGFVFNEIRTSHKMDDHRSGIENPDHLDGPFTGGFGEQTCHSCHFDYDLNMEGGRLELEGMPDNYKAGKEYRLRVRISSEQLETGGFQLAARFSKSGKQAGTFSWEGKRLMFTPESAVGDQIQYVQHSAVGTSPTSDKTVEWTFTWTAPENGEGSIQFNIASNAGNDDDSSFGDRIYVMEMTSIPAE